MWAAIHQQLAKRFSRHVAVFQDRVYDRNRLGERLPVLMLGDKTTLAAAETSHLMALPLEVLELILRYAIANSVVEVREVQDYLDESAVRMIDFPTGDAVNAGGLMPSTASSLLRVNKAISRVLIASFDLPDTLFSRDTKFMFSLMNDIEISRAHIHIHICRIFCRGNSRWIDNWELWKYERQGHLGQSFVFKGEA